MDGDVRTAPRLSSPVRVGLAVFLLLHGIAHLAGAGDAFTAADRDDTVDYFFGAWEVGGAVLATLGVLWVVLAATFVITAGWVASSRPNWLFVLAGAAAASLVLSILALPLAWIGVLINAALLGFVVVQRR